MLRQPGGVRPPGVLEHHHRRAPVDGAVVTARHQLASLLREYEHRLRPKADYTPRGVAESLKGDREHPDVLDDAEIIEGLADQFGVLDLDLTDAYARLA